MVKHFIYKIKLPITFNIGITRTACRISYRGIPFPFGSCKSSRVCILFVLILFSICRVIMWLVRNEDTRSLISKNWEL